MVYKQAQSRTTELKAHNGYKLLNDNKAGKFIQNKDVHIYMHEITRRILESVFKYILFITTNVLFYKI